MTPYLYHYATIREACDNPIELDTAEDPIEALYMLRNYEAIHYGNRIQEVFVSKDFYSKLMRSIAAKYVEFIETENRSSSTIRILGILLTPTSYLEGNICLVLEAPYIGRYYKLNVLEFLETTWKWIWANGKSEWVG